MPKGLTMSKTAQIKTKVSDIVGVLESIAPPALAEKWDNVGLLVGSMDSRAEKLMLCIDLTQAVLAEAVRTNASMVMAYHPVLFKPVSRVTAQATPMAYEAARKGISVYCMHTALDAAKGGTNAVLAEVMGLIDVRPLQATVSRQNCMIVVFVPPADATRVTEAAFAAGAGRIGDYFDCSFYVSGTGTFCGGPDTRPAIGRPLRHESVQEQRLEMIAPRDRAAAVCDAIRGVHSYEEPAIDVYPLEDHPAGLGMGRIGCFEPAMKLNDLVGRIKKAMGVDKAMLVSAAGEKAKGKGGELVNVGACCAGAGGSLVSAAISAGADFFLTGKIRHHDALAAIAGGMNVMCLGHWTSERIALRSLAQRISAKLPAIDVIISKADREPFEIV